MDKSSTFFPDKLIRDLEDLNLTRHFNLPHTNHELTVLYSPQRTSILAYSYHGWANAPKS